LQLAWHLPGSFAEGGPRRFINAKRFEAHLSISNEGAKGCHPPKRLQVLGLPGRGAYSVHVNLAWNGRESCSFCSIDLFDRAKCCPVDGPAWTEGRHLWRPFWVKSPFGNLGCYRDRLGTGFQPVHSAHVLEGHATMGLHEGRPYIRQSHPPFGPGTLIPRCASVSLGVKEPVIGRV
jgi:hypothetical protein